MTQIHCPHCDHSLVDDGKLAGQVVACPQCQGQFRMPNPAEPPVIVNDPPVATSPLSSSTYRTSNRRRGRRKDPIPLVVFGLTALVALVAGVGFLIFQRSEPKPTDLSGSKAASTQSQSPTRTQTNSNATEQKDAEAAKLTAERERRQREEEAQLETERRMAELNAQRRIDEEVRRQLEERRMERESRLAGLAERERREIPPIEAEIQEIRTKIATGDRNMARLRQQMQSLPQSSGIPGGSRFNPSISREVRDIERRGIQNWQERQKGDRRIY